MNNLPIGLVSSTRKTSRTGRVLLTSFAIGAFFIAHATNGASPAPLAGAAPPFEGVKTAWQGGFDRYDFAMDEHSLEIKPIKRNQTGVKESFRCIVVVPTKALAGNPWSWLDLISDSQSQTERELLERGFHVAYTTPGTVQQREAWQEFLVAKHGLSKKPVVIGASKGSLKAGTAKVDITPDKTKQPVHDRVHARALVLDIDGERVAFVSVDLGIYTSEHLVSVCKEKFGLSQMFLSSSHTHSDPGRGYAAFFEEKIMQALDESVKNMFPARISAGHRNFPQLGFNRLVVREDEHARESWFSDGHYRSENPERIPFGPVDPEVGVIKIEDTAGKPKAIIMNYACHADVVCQNYAISADYPGRRLQTCGGGFRRRP